MSLRSIGPIDIDLLNPSFEFDSAPDLVGNFRRVTISGAIEWNPADQLSELTANADARVTVGGETGVLEYVYSDDELLSTYNGWYLLQPLKLAADQASSIGGPSGPRSGLVGFSLSALCLGDYQPTT